MKLVTEISKDLRVKLEELYARHERIDIAIESILEGQQGGNIKLWVDQKDHPKLSKIEHGSFIRFAGDPEENKGSSTMISRLTTPFFLQPSPAGWMQLLEKAYGVRLKKTKRYKFSSTHLSKSHMEEIIYKSPWRDAIRRLEKQHVEQLSEDDWGKYHFMNYAKPEDLIAKGIGYYLEKDGEIVSCCSSALISSNSYEVNIITKPAYRQQGIAKAVAAKFIEACLAKGMEPHWDAANEPSKRLALRLGYQFEGSYDLHYVM